MAHNDPLPPNVPGKYKQLFQSIRFCRDLISENFGRCSKLLVLPHDNYDLSFQLYDDGKGLHDVVSLVPDQERRLGLVRRCLEERPNQRLQWRASPEKDVPISFIVDQSKFSSMTEVAQRNEYFTQADTALHVGGTLFCFLPMNSIALFFSHFIRGWIIMVHTIPEQASTDVLLSAVKVIPQLAFPVALYNVFDFDSEELTCEIVEENQRRKDIRGQISGDFSELRHWSEVAEARGVDETVFRLEFKLTGTRLTGTISESDFLITLHDLKKPVSKYKVIVYYIPRYMREEKIAKRENHKFLTTITSSSFCRFLVVCPGEGVEVDLSESDVKDLLEKLLTALTPRKFLGNSNNSVFKNLTKNSVKPVNKAMKGCTSGLPPHDPEHQEELHRSPSNPKIGRAHV